MGGLVAYEMARQLRLSGKDVGILVLFDTMGASAAGQEIPEPDDIDLLIGSLGHYVNLSKDTLLQLDEDQQLAYVLDEVRRTTPLPPDFSVADARHMLRVLKSNVAAAWRYRRQPYDGPLTLFCSNSTETGSDPAMGWGQLVTGPVQVEVIPASHRAMMEEGAVALVADRLKVHLSRAAPR